MTAEALAAIVARDAAYDTMGVVLDEAAADGSRGGRMQMAADRRALLALLREAHGLLIETHDRHGIGCDQTEGCRITALLWRLDGLLPTADDVRGILA